MEQEMELSEYFPVWDQLSGDEQSRLRGAAQIRRADQGTVLQGGRGDCVGLVLVRQGRLRACSVSPEGRQVTLYRLLPGDICLFSASCMMRSLQTEILIEAERDTEFWLISPEVYRQVMEESAPLANFTNELMAGRLSEVMWLMEQIMWQSMDKRLATFLLEESGLEESDTLTLTHEQIAGHLGTAREVVSRMLKYFQEEGMVRLRRGAVELIAPEKLRQLAS